jgi:hypothetical protein
LSFQYTSGDPSHLTGGASASMADIQGPFTDLKTFLNARIAAIPALVSSLPAGPVDGQEIYYQADAANGIVWHLRYRAASASSFKWEYIGGTPLTARVNAQETRTVTTYGDLTTVGPSITAPLAGDYLLSYSAHMWNSAVGNYVIASPAVGATAATDANGAVMTSSTANADYTPARVDVPFTGVAAAAVIKLQYRTLGTTASIQNRMLSVRPIRVG